MGHALASSFGDLHDHMSSLACHHVKPVADGQREFLCMSSRQTRCGCQWMSVEVPTILDLQVRSVG